MRELRALGFETVERSFEFSSFPGRYGTPLVGGAAAMLVGLAGQRGAEGQRFAPLAIGLAGVVALLLVARWLTRPGVLRAPLLRQRGVNVEATRPGPPPMVWLCAHVDSKSQPIPTLVRTIGIVVEAVGFLFTLGLAVAVALGAQTHAFYWMQAALVTLLGAIPVVSSVVGARSPGALDNASGVATVIEAARQLGSESRVGVLLTDAEELGLAGARSWAGAAIAGRAPILNCDGVDDHGRIAVMYSGSRPAAVMQAVERASAATGVAHEGMRLIPGILTDSVAFSDAGIASITFSRGTVRTLMRVHSRSDSLANLRGTGVAETAALMAATAREIMTMEKT